MSWCEIAHRRVKHTDRVVGRKLYKMYDWGDKWVGDEAPYTGHPVSWQSRMMNSMMMQNPTQSVVKQVR